MNRRAYLKLIAGTSAASALAGCSDWTDSDEETETAVPDRTEAPPETTETPPEETEDEDPTEQFDTVVNMVEDAGCDPDGDDPCDQTFRETVADDTLLLFPSGTYRFEETNRVFGINNVGVMGEGDVTFEAPAGLNGQWIVFDQGRDLLFRNVTLDVSADNCAPTLKLAVEDGLDVRDVEVDGRGIVEGSAPRGENGNVSVGSSLLPVVRSPDGEGIVERYVVETGGRIGTYNRGDGRAGIYIGPSHRGTIDLVDCRLEEFPNNGIYASRTTGIVNVEGGTFRNNDISQVRLGSEGSTVTGAMIEVDIDEVGGPSDPNDYLNPRGVRIESGQIDTEGQIGSGGVTVHDTDVRMLEAPQSPGIAVGNNGGEFTIESSRVTVVSDGSPGIIAKSPTGGQHYKPPPEPHSGTIKDVQIVGSSSSSRAIWLIQRGGTELENVQVDQPGPRRDGLYLSRSPDCTLSDCTILAGRYPILVRPDQEAIDDCLVTLDEMEYLGSVGNLQQTVYENFPTNVTDAGTICVDSAPQDFDGVSDPVIAITEVRNDNVLKEVLPRQSLEG